MVRKDDDSSSDSKASEGPQARHAVIVLKRIIRSRHRADALLQDRVFRAAEVVS